jgi:glycosyltransferase involved in cell wall biosynthesis
LRGAQPLVSVVMPAWNAEATIVEALRSVAAQTYRNLEIIIVDDGSSDGTAELAKDFCVNDPRARTLGRSNSGPAAARNLGIVEARGEWIALIDADDVWHPTKVEKQVAVALAADEPPGFVYCWYRKIDEDGFVIGSGPRWAAEGKAFLSLAYLHFIRGGSSLLLSKAAFTEAGGYDESFRAGCEDVVLELEIARRRPIAVVPEFLFGYRAHGSNFTRDFDLLLDGWTRAFAAVQGRAQLPRNLIRQANAQCSVAVAVQRAVERRPGPSLKAAARALALDPVRSGLSLLGTAVDVGARRLRSRAVAGEGRPFDQVGTTENLDLGPGVWFWKLVDRLDGRRMRNLAQS